MLVSGILSTLLFLRFFSGLGLILRSRYFGLLGFGLWLLRPNVFHGDGVHVALIVGSVAALALLVYFSNKQNNFFWPWHQTLS